MPQWESEGRYQIIEEAQKMYSQCEYCRLEVLYVTNDMKYIQIENVLHNRYNRYIKY